MAVKATKKNKFVKAWMAEHVNDPWVKEATRLGYRSRAAFKLIELAEKDKLLRPGMRIVDLGAAPGSWTQVLRERVGAGRRDRRDRSPADGADRRRDVRPGRLSRGRGPRRRSKVRSAGTSWTLWFRILSPNLSGVEAADQARSVHLGELALEFAAAWLQPGGDLVVKAFQGEGFAALRRAVEARFAKVYVRKPQASRDRSREVYVVAKGLKS